MENLNNYVSIEKLNIVCNSIEKAHGLPNECYLGGDYSKYERKYLFEDKWVVIGVASSLKNIGDEPPEMDLSVKEELSSFVAKRKSEGGVKTDF